MTSTALAKAEKAKQFLVSAAFAEQVRETLPPGLSLERFMRTTKSAVQADPDLLNHDHRSLWSSIVSCARDGLLPDGREAALVAYGGKVQYLPMVGGLRKRAAEFGLRIDAYVVYEHDEFGYGYGLDPYVTHKPVPLGSERGNAIGAYAVGTDARGRKYLEVMSHADIEKVRKAARTQNVWSQHWGEMARKTVARRLFKSLPLYDESFSRLLDSVDAEFERPDDKVSREVGWVGPPTDDPGPDDSSDDDVVGGEATLVAESAEEPETVDVSAPVLSTGSPASVTEPGSSADIPPMGEGEQSSFAVMAERAQKSRDARRGGGGA